MHTTDDPLTDEQSSLDAAVIDYIDSEELTDTATLPEPISEKIADKISHVLEDAAAVINSHTDKD